MGLGALAAILALDAMALGLMTRLHFPAEVVSRTLVTALPWILGGLVSYLGTALVLLEPGWRLRPFNLVVALGLLGLYLHPAPPGAYARILPHLAALALLVTPSILVPAYRFRFRRG